jgi:hypothetical protein
MDKNGDVIIKSGRRSNNVVRVPFSRGYTGLDTLISYTIRDLNQKNKSNMQNAMADCRDTIVNYLKSGGLISSKGIVKVDMNQFNSIFGDNYEFPAITRLEVKDLEKLGIAADEFEFSEKQLFIFIGSNFFQNINVSFNRDKKIFFIIPGYTLTHQIQLDLDLLLNDLEDLCKVIIEEKYALKNIGIHPSYTSMVEQILLDLIYQES